MDMLNQITVSQFKPPFTISSYPTVTSNDWSYSMATGTGFSSVATAVQAFFNFFVGIDTTNLSMQVPFTAMRAVSRYDTWQANDPLVHYTLGDLAGFGDLSPPGNGTTNYVDYGSNTNQFLPNARRVNDRYLPWNAGGNPNAASYDPKYLNDPALKDPLVRSSDDWNFPAGNLGFASVGRVHRGTPWQTVYLKSGSVDAVVWQVWTGDTTSFVAPLSKPTNDWRIAGMLAQLLNPIHPIKLYSVNHTNLAVVMNGMTAITNSVPPAAFEMDANSPQMTAIVAGINATRAAQPGGMFQYVSDILSAPQLTTASPWLDLNFPEGISDEAYETLPCQLLPFLRPDSIGSISIRNGTGFVQFTGMDGYPYRIETSTNLRDWTPVATMIPANGQMYLPEIDATNEARYYRSVLIGW